MHLALTGKFVEIRIVILTLDVFLHVKRGFFNRRKKDMDPIYSNFYIVYQSCVKFQNNYFLSDF